ncbi:MAG: peptidoglycan DD-metalloendopeptidase family protein [Oscillibacter sp.]|jgi:murein DD-endopeptidase MepM/ murein hydrolase activator NlpD|nr:peptidoglycan DD-metalloendopeptidase family protein [Oscillibacter sp.]
MSRLLRNRALRRGLKTVLAVVFALALLVPSVVPQAQAVTQKQINALKNSAGNLATKKKQLQSKLDALADDKSAAVERKKLLDEQIQNIAQQISNSEQQISEYASLIGQTQAELAEAQEKEQKQYELYCERVRAMEERGAISYWSVLFKANSLTDLLSRLDFINEIMDSDQSVINHLQTLQTEIKAKEENLQASKSSEEEARSDLVSRKTELNSKRAQADKLVLEIEQNEDEYSDTLDDIAAEEEEIQNRIVQMSRELAAQQEAERKKQQAAGQPVTPSVSESGYIWPVSSHKITSGFGYRSASSTGGVGSTYHKGIDIGGVGYGSAVHAAKSGTVIVAQYSSSYGNYVVIAHGSGSTTLYGHMSSLAVSAGQSVTQGNVIGYTGSTGHSTGPHLHFEITINGSRVNPANYLP